MVGRARMKEDRPMGKLAGAKERKKKGVSEMGSFISVFLLTHIDRKKEEREGRDAKKKKKIIPRCKSPAEPVQQSQE